MVRLLYWAQLNYYTRSYSWFDLRSALGYPNIEALYCSIETLYSYCPSHNPSGWNGLMGWNVLWSVFFGGIGVL